MANTAWADVPFDPHPTAVDHIVIKTFKSMGNPKEGTLTVLHHNGWTRIDRILDGKRSTTFFGKSSNINIRVSHPEHDREFLTIRFDDPEPNRIVVNTGERQMHLGESCTVWRTWFSGTWQRLNCITDDGIELWNRLQYGDGKISNSTEATSITRRVVAPHEVHPPKDLLDLQRWLGADHKLDWAGEFDGYETVLQEKRIPGFQQITRKSGPWSVSYDLRSNPTHWNAERVGKEREFLYVSHKDAGYSLVLHRRDGKNTYLSMSKRKPLPAAGLLQAKPEGKKEIVLGEECEWFDVQPGMMDASEHRCRTADGITLQLRKWGRGHGPYHYEATKFIRGKVSTAAAMPPKELLDPKTWGLPE